MYLLQTFGGLALVDATTREQIGAPSRKPLALLALVAAAGERGVERDWLAGLLWPTLDEAHARRALSQTLYALRREIGADVLRGERRFTVEPSVLTTDAAEFERLARAGGSRQDLERAASLYAGPYLDGVYFPGCTEFEQWAETSRAVHAASYLGVLRELARTAKEAGDGAMAIHWLERAARDFPLDSDVAFALATAYAIAGRHGQGHVHLTTHFAALRAELGEAPPESLAELARQLQRARGAGATAPVSSSWARSNANRAARRTAASERRPPFDSARSAPIAQTGIGRLGGDANPLRRTAAIVGGLVVVATLGWLFGVRPEARAFDSLPAAFTAEVDHPRRIGPTGRVLVKVGSFPGARTPLAQYVEDVLTERLARSGDLVPTERVRTLSDDIRAAHRDTTREPLDIADRLLDATGAAFALEAMVVGDEPGRDSLMLSITLHRRAAVPPCPPGWFGRREKADIGIHDGFESWSSLRIQTPKAAPTRYVDSLVRSATRMLESMRTCDLEAHRGVTTSPWCWTAPNRVGVVPGVMRARIASGEDIVIMMHTDRVKPGRSCIYSSRGRIDG